SSMRRGMPNRRRERTTPAKPASPAARPRAGIGTRMGGGEPAGRGTYRAGGSAAPGAPGRMGGGEMEREGQTGGGRREGGRRRREPRRAQRTRRKNTEKIYISLLCVLPPCPLRPPRFLPMNKLRWGILGVAKINERLLPAFAAAGNAELVAIASRTPERAKAA